MQSLWPGCAITYRNVLNTPYGWWRKYVLSAVEIERKNRERSRG